MYKKVLVPLDGSELAECALDHVKSLCKDGSVGEVILLSVVNINFSWLENGYNNYVPNIGKIREELLLSAGKYLADVESKLSSEGIKVITEVLGEERPAHYITDYANQNGIDLIVMATHGYTGMKKMLLGSVASGILHESHVPVLLIRPESCKA